MRLLVTRPEPEAAATAARLTAMGHTVTVEPLLHIVFAEPPTDLPAPAALILTSGNAVRAIAKWPRAAAWHGIPAFAVGEATASIARAAGFRDVHSANGEAAALAKHIRTASLPGRGPILYPAARDRARALAEELTAHGYDVHTVEAYRAEKAEALSPTLRDALAKGALDGALFYSRRTAEAFRDLTAGHTIRLPHFFALSDRVAEPLVGFAESRCHIAAAPDEPSLFAIILPA